MVDRRQWRSSSRRSRSAQGGEYAARVARSLASRRRRELVAPLDDERGRVDDRRRQRRNAAAIIAVAANDLNSRI